jgi:hypothetical protein
MFYYMQNYYMLIYGTMCWQGDQGYNACAISPHAAQVLHPLDRALLLYHTSRPIPVKARPV